jgi:hypothetical protein
LKYFGEPARITGSPIMLYTGATTLDGSCINVKVQYNYSLVEQLRNLKRNLVK